MLLYLLLIALTVFLICSAVYCIKNDKEIGSPIFSILSVFAFSAVLGFSINMALVNSDARDFKERRDCCEDMVRNISDNMSFKTVSTIMLKAMAINDAIEKNKRNAYSPVYGSFYNKKIAEFEPIDIPELHISATIYNEKEE